MYIIYLFYLVGYASSIGYGIKHAANIIKRSGRDKEAYLKTYWLHLAANVFVVITIPASVLVTATESSGGFILVGIIGGIVLYSLKIIE